MTSVVQVVFCFSNEMESSSEVNAINILLIFGWKMLLTPLFEDIWALLHFSVGNSPWRSYTTYIQKCSWIQGRQPKSSKPGNIAGMLRL
jgi:hypothetical protein